MEWVRTEIDGVPVFWSAHDGDLTAGLVFRVGSADEQLARRGITHLVEHLALSELDERPDHVNGAVDATLTTFLHKGSPERVAEFFARLCGVLADLPVTRLAVENQLLLTEADARGRDIASSLAIWRYGAATYGLPGYDECGIGLHTPEEVRAWARGWFTRGNAAMWLIGGPPPEGLRFPLPDGPRVPPPLPTSALRRTPAYFHAQLNGIAASSVIERSAAGIAYADLLQRRLYQNLRVAQGISYSQSASYDRRDGDMAEISAFADGLPSVHGKLVRGFAEVLDWLCELPVREHELDELLELRRAPLRDPKVLASLPVGAAEAELLGAEPPTVASLVDELAVLSEEDIQDVAISVRDNLLLMVPEGHEPPPRYTPAPTGSTGTVEGELLVSIDSATPGREGRPFRPGNEGRPRLCVGPTGV
ncbi:insulinase family protein, partial [Crossiella equi]